MNRSIYRVILGYVAVVGSALHTGNIISPRLVMWGFLLPRCVSVIVLLSLVFLGFLVVTDKD